ncbi:Neuronal regeneration-related protein [Varanus komodoensis]|nr:Neuronal regeneration-related protein [Varanus komodoensis]
MTSYQLFLWDKIGAVCDQLLDDHRQLSWVIDLEDAYFRIIIDHIHPLHRTLPLIVNESYPSSIHAEQDSHQAQHQSGRYGPHNTKVAWAHSCESGNGPVCFTQDNLPIPKEVNRKKNKKSEALFLTPANDYGHHFTKINYLSSF